MLYQNEHLTSLRLSLFVIIGLLCLVLTITTKAQIPDQCLKPSGDVTPLPSAEVFERDLKGGETHQFCLVLEPGEYARILIEQLGIDILVRVFGPDGTKITEVDRPNGSYGPDRVSVIATEPGPHRLQLNSFEPAANQGRYRISLEEKRQVVESDARRVRAEQGITIGEQLRTRETEENLANAVRRLEETVGIWQELKDDYEQAVALYSLAMAHRSQGETERSITTFGRALQIARALGDSHGQAVYQTGLGWAYIYAGDIENALAHFSDALRLRRENGDKRGEALSLYGEGWAYALAGQNERALGIFEHSLQLRRELNDNRGQSLTLTGIGKMLHQLGRNKEAHQRLTKALEISGVTQSSGVADTLSALGWVYLSEGQTQKAHEHFQQALSRFRALGDQTGEATTLYGSARTLAQMGRLQTSQAEIEEALDIIESIRTRGFNQRLRTSYFGLVRDYYEFYVDLLMTLHRQDPSGQHLMHAFDVYERSRNRNLLDLLNESGGDLREGVDESLVKTERTLRQKMNELTRTAGGAAKMPELLDQMRILTTKYEETLALIRQASPHYAMLTQARPVSVKDIQRELLDKDTTLLAYALGKERSYLWQVTNRDIVSYKLPPRSEIEATALQLHRLITARNRRKSGEPPQSAEARREYMQVVVTLSRQLLGPVKATLKSKRLAIIAPGALQFVPFAALPITDSRDAGTSSRNFNPLITRHEVVNIPSASTLAVLRRVVADREPAPKILAVIADPVFAQSDERFKLSVGDNARKEIDSEVQAPDRTVNRWQHLPRLFSSRWEAINIGSMVASDMRLEALDFSANKELVTGGKLNEYQSIHFATHAVIDNEHPEWSGIALSAVDSTGRSVDGFLRTQEIYALKLPVELVVLSACRTALGKEVKGEGPVAITHAFMYAGAPRVVASLWAVEDKATSELMVRLYRKLLGAEGLTAAAALRSAQLELSRDPRWSSPYFWAGFVLQGDWR